VYETLGAGQLATCVRADDGRMDVALRRLHPGLETERDQLDAFISEARLAHQLVHPHLGRVFAFGKYDGIYFAAQELVLGPTIGAVLRQCRSAAGAIPIGITVELMLQLCDALAHLHGAGIAYRGVTADKLLISRQGRIKLVDFRRARSVAHFDPRGDLLAAGVLAHELLVGRALDEPTPPSRWAPDVSPELDDIVMLALERDVTKRWQSAAAMRTALDGVARQLGGRLVIAQHMRDWLHWAFARKPRRHTTYVSSLVEWLEKSA
jgi:serine/threonine-protein kinase